MTVVNVNVTFKEAVYDVVHNAIMLLYVYRLQFLSFTHLTPCKFVVLIFTKSLLLRQYDCESLYIFGYLFIYLFTCIVI